MFKNNKIIYGLVALFVGVAMSFSTVNAQVTGEEQQEATTQNSITGKVVDAQTGQPLNDVTVEVEGQDQQSITDEDGRFTLDLHSGVSGEMDEMGETMEESSGEITIRIDHDGYESFSETIRPEDWAQQRAEGAVEGAEGEENMLTFELQPKEQGDDYEGDY